MRDPLDDTDDTESNDTRCGIEKMKIEFGTETYQSAVWTPADGCVSDVLAYDTETTEIQDAPPVVPEFVIGSVFDGERVSFLRRQDLAEFWSLHGNFLVAMHSAAFDMDVTEKACGFDFAPMIEAGRVLDTSILYRLERLARTGVMPMKYNLALVTRELLGLELEKDREVRCGFGEFLKDGRVDYKTIPLRSLEYAARDPVATFLIAAKLQESCRLFSLNTPLGENGTDGTNGITALAGPLSHHVQLRGEFALRRIERRGLCIDQVAVTNLERELDAEVEKNRLLLSRHGFVPGKPGNTEVYEKAIAEIEARRGVQVRVCETSGRKGKAEDDLITLRDEEFVGAYLDYGGVAKIRKTYLSRLTGKSRVYPRYGLMTVTGRTTCSGFNVQNLPRKGRVRECVVASPGHVIVACDYSMLELCTLAQVAYARQGSSRMRELINDGVDLHRFLAARVLGKEPGLVTKEDRQKAKAIGFGLPGGMGTSGLRD